MIVAAVDLRPQLLPVRNQGRRPTCLAFASSAAHEHRLGQYEHLSVEYLYFHSVACMPGKDPDSGATMAATVAALAANGQPVESAWPYSPVAVASWSPPRILGPLHTRTMLPGLFAYDEITTALAQARPVVLGLRITDAFFHPDVNGLVRFVTTDVERGGHAVLAVGYGKSSTEEPALLIRNSWGQGWGLAGHAWLPRSYVERGLHETALIV